MAKVRVSLDAEAAPTFKHKVDIPTPVGAAAVEFVFKYRDRVAMAALLDRWDERAKAARSDGDDGADADENFETAAKKNVKADVDLILDIADGWDLPWQFGAEKLELFVTRYPGAASAVVAAYHKACWQGRLGN